MLNEDLDVFEDSDIVEDYSVVSSQYIEEENVRRTKVRAELINGWTLDCWERIETRGRRYSFHVFDGDELITRWDNADHHGHLDNFPTIST